MPRTVTQVTPQQFLDLYVSGNLVECVNVTISGQQRIYGKLYDVQNDVFRVVWCAP